MSIIHHHHNHPHTRCPNPPIQTSKSAPPVIPKIPDCYDCGAFNIQGLSGEKCCPAPANFPPPLDTSCCQYQYKKPGLIVCYKKTKYKCFKQFSAQTLQIYSNTKKLVIFVCL